MEAHSARGAIALCQLVAVGYRELDGIDIALASGHGVGSVVSANDFDFRADCFRSGDGGGHCFGGEFQHWSVSFQEIMSCYGRHSTPTIARVNRKVAHRTNFYLTVRFSMLYPAPCLFK